MAIDDKKLLRITGRVIDQTTKGGIAALRVEAWDKGLVVKEPFATAITDPQGFFIIEFKQKRLDNFFGGRQALLFFNVFRDNDQIASTQDSIIWSRESPDQIITIPIKPADAPVDKGKKPKPLKVRGQIRRQDGSPVRKATVRAFITTPEKEIALGEAQTDAEGNYEIVPAADPSSLPPPANAQLQARVFDKQGTRLATSSSPMQEGAATMDIVITDLTYFVRGTIRDVNGKPLQSGIVRLLGTAVQPEERLGETNELNDGQYQIDYKPGRYVDPDSHVVVRAYVIVNNQEQLLFSSPLFRVSPEEVVDLPIKGDPGTLPSVVRGHVTGSVHPNYAKAVVRLFLQSAGPDKQLGVDAITNDNGRYEINYDPVVVRATVSPQAIVRVFDARGPLLTASPPFALPHSDDVNLNVDESTVFGRVLQSDNKTAFAGGIVRAFYESGPDITQLGDDAITGPDGRYIISYPSNLIAGTINLRVRVYDSFNKFRIESARIAGAINNQEVNITLPADVAPGVEYHVEGYIFLDNGLRADSIPVRLYNMGFGGTGTPFPDIRTDAQGFYALSYNKGNMPVNLQVRVVDPQGNEIPISNTKFNVGQREVLTLIAPARVKPLASEYQRLIADLRASLGPQAILGNARENAASRDLTLLHQATGWDARLIALAATANRHSSQTGMAEEALYALFRGGLPTDKQKLAGVGVSAIQSALDKANEAGIVSLNASQISSAIAAFRNLVGQVRLTATAPGALSTIGDALDASGLTDIEKQTFAELYFANPNDGAQLWQSALNNKKISPDKVGGLQLQGKLAYLTFNNTRLGQSIQEAIRMNIRDDMGSGGTLPPLQPENVNRLVNLNLFLPAEWTQRLNSLAGNNEPALAALIPPAYVGSTTAERLNAYSEDLARRVRLSFPTQVVAQLIGPNNLQLDDSSASLNTHVKTFLKNAGSVGFELGRVPVDTFIEQQIGTVFQGIPPDKQDVTKQAVKRLQRLYQITPSDGAMKELYRLGFNSARDLTAFSFNDFMDQFGAGFPSLDEARLAYRKAQQVSAVTHSFFVAAKQLDSAPPVYALSPSTSVREAAKNELKKYYPNIETLFGSLDFCECEHCRSVLSPAAYLVDLLQFLDPEDSAWQLTLSDWKRKHSGAPYPFANLSEQAAELAKWAAEHPGETAPAPERKPYAVLIARRPDLPNLQLTCENTNTALPYIDVVNEILEYYVAKNHLDEAAVRDTGDATTAELLAEPQNITAHAYDILLETRYPLGLPFDLWLETVRQFFDYFETPLWKVLEVFRQTDELFPPQQNAKPYYRSAIFREYLRLSPAEHAIFIDGSPLTNWHELYGYTSPATALDALKSAKTLARKLGVSYKELIGLIGTGFVNPQLDTLVILRKLGIDIHDVFRYKQTRFAPEERAAFEERLNHLTKTFQASGFNASRWLDTEWQKGSFNKILLLDDPDTGCNFDQTTLRYADNTAADEMAFLKINLFVRLWKKLGWSIEETDRALQTFLPGGSISLTAGNIGAALNTALIYIAHLKALDEQVKAGKDSRLKLLTLWSNLATTGNHPLYAQLFLTPSVLKNDLVFDDPLGNYLPPPGPPLSDHLLAVQGALNLTVDEIGRILVDNASDLETAKLTLVNVSLLYRYGLLAKTLKLSVQDFIDLKALSGLDPFKPLRSEAFKTLSSTLDLASTLNDDYPFTQTLSFIEVTSKVKESGFKVEDLNYLLRHRFDPVGQYRTHPDALPALVKSLAGDLGRIQTEQTVPDSLTNDLLMQKLALVLTPDSLASFIGAITGTAETEVIRDVQLADRLDPKAFANERDIRVSYNEISQQQHLVYRGLLLDAQKDHLKTLSSFSLLAGMLDQVQTQGYELFAKQIETVVDSLTDNAGAEALVEASLGVMLEKIEFTATDENVQPADKLNPEDFEREPRIQVAYDDVAAWDQATTYQVNDAVSFNGSAWVAKRTNTNISPANGADWSGPLGRRQSLTLRGLLSDAKKAQLKRDNHSTVLAGRLDAVQNQAQAFIQKLRVGFLAQNDFTPLFARLDAISDADGDPRAKLAQAVLPFIIRKLNQELIVQTLASNLNADRGLTEALLIDSRLLTDPALAGKPLIDAFIGAAEQGATTSTPDGLDSIRLEGYLEVPTAGNYRFFAVLAKKDAEVEFRLGNSPDVLFRGKAAGNGSEISEFIELKSGLLYRFTLDGRHLGGGTIDLLVQGENLPKGSLARLRLYPEASVERVRRADVLLAKTLQLIQRLGLTEREVRYLLTHSADFDTLDLSKLPTRESDDSAGAKALAMTLFKQFLRLADYARLKHELAGDTDDLIGIFENARRTFPASAIASQAQATVFDDLCKRLADLTRRDVRTIQETARQLGFVAAQPTNNGVALHVEVPDFEQEKGIRRLWEALQVVERLGVSVEAIKHATGMVDAGNPPATRFAIAQGLRNTVKARYDSETWQGIAQPIFNNLRQRQRDALVAYILHAMKFERMEQLFEYFLIDPGMEPVVQTSRLRLAISSVQTFIQRCLLNLEREVHPSVINSAHWAWMKRYRIWEANRKIFFFPENWLEPEFRDDKTPLFKELEGALLQGDVSNELAEDAFFTYLKKLEALARLEIVTMYNEEKPDDPASNTMHVIGRTYSLPHQYFYRRFAHQMWTPWEPVTAEIEGDHVVAVVWRQRLHLFWLTFLEIADTAANDTRTPSAMANVPSAMLKPKTLVKVKLNWSEYFKGEWTTRQSTAFSEPLPLAAGGNSANTAGGEGVVFVISGGTPVEPVRSFNASEVFIHVTREFVSKEEGKVNIHIGGAINWIFRFAKNSPQETDLFGAFTRTSSLSSVAMPYMVNALQMTRFLVSDALAVLFTDRTVTAGGNTETVISHPRDILQPFVGEFSVVRSSNLLEITGDEIRSLVSPFFLVDNQNTFFVEPTLTETTIPSYDNWVPPPASPDPTFIDPSFWKNLPLGGFVKFIDPNIPIAPDSLRLFEFKPNQDWLTDPASVLQFGETYVGSTGEFQFTPFINAGDSASFNPGTLIPGTVAFIPVAGNASVPGGGLSLIGSAGLNSVLLNNLITRRQSNRAQSPTTLGSAPPLNTF